jgi:NSS family neurotransmitter:Na+ symporter
MAKPHPRQAWSSRLGFILATIGSAVGLGSIWKFPYEVGENGGGAFLLFYLLGLSIVVAPLLVAEFVIGRRGRGDAAASIAAVALEAGRSIRWGGIGLLMIATGFLILSYYAVIGGMTVAYFVRAASGSFAGVDAETTGVIFEALVSRPWSLAGYQALFIAVTVVVVARGVGRGIELACRVLMPVLVVLMITLALYAAVEGRLGAALEFLFVPHMEAFNPRVALQALGLGFFSIGVGLGVMITYAAYARSNLNLTSVAVAILVGDTAISLLAGLAIFPLVFAHHLDPAEGTGLMFLTLPIAFGQLPFGSAVGAAFFLSLVVAALASAMSLLELVVAPVTRLMGLPRPGSAAILGVLCWLTGLPVALSFNVWSGLRPLAALPGFEGSGIYEAVDGFASNLLLPLGGLSLSLFAGWRMRRHTFERELGWPTAVVTALMVVLRWVVPASIAAFVVMGQWAGARERAQIMGTGISCCGAVVWSSTRFTPGMFSAATRSALRSASEPAEPQMLTTPFETIILLPGTVRQG